MTPLARRLAAQIRANGPLTVAEYMAACLGDPHDGYYMRHEPFGASGDFVTAPEVSQMFGELIGLWAVGTWVAMGSPARFRLVELGPGRGTLMTDALRAATVRPAFGAAADVHLIETSPRLRDIQHETLAATPVAWHDRFEDVPDGPLIVLANEFFDALPVLQFVRTDDGWAERMIGLDEEGGLAWGLRPVPPTSSFGGAKRRPEDRIPSGIPANRSADRHDPPVKPEDDGSRPGDDGGGVWDGERNVDADTVLELSPVRSAVMASIAGRVAHDGGAALVIDYGHDRPGFGDTLQAVRRHQHDDVLANPGEADLTAHVDFAALVETARAAGADPRPVITQGEFLSRLGIAARAERLAAGKSDEVRAGIAAAVERLTGDDAMGRLFKVLAISSPGLALPGFDDTSGSASPGNR